MYQDLPITVFDTAVHWVEYVICHIGVPYLRPVCVSRCSYSENAKRVSALFRDRPMTAIETAVYWVEYVIRHRGAPHMRSAAADMPLYQYLLLDVIGMLVLVAASCVYIAYCVVKALTVANTDGHHGKHVH
ncbi:hypothetical protein PR048_015206 [Dryococelus australis]|uniref:Uncharacterized protein n=1 Tax=Dryococelus australis TaxID=614101 RepID=A0ABQ9HGA4_9NEOP|nr:hypothetical protein PR048_015206 [Dryococelus australis]